MSHADNHEIMTTFDLKQWIEGEGLSFTETRGRSGAQLNLKVCPHCGDRRSKVYLNEENGIGNCFACDEGFNKAKFVKASLDLSWADTFKRIREACKEQGWRPRKRIEVAVELETAVMPNSFALPTPEGQNLQYLEGRGITAEWAKYFHLRFCDSGWWNFTRPDGTKGGQKFDGRVLVPVYDLDGVFQTFQGRDIVGVAERKYLFPSGLPGTGRFLLNGQNALRRREVAIGEGFFDVAAMKIAFDEEPSLRHVEPVGTFGKNLSYGSSDGNDQLGRFVQLKREGLKLVTICYDGEEKALLAALEAAERLHRLGLAVKIALLPAGRDPNEITAAQVREAYWKATPLSASIAVKWRLHNPYRRR